MGKNILIITAIIVSFFLGKFFENTGDNSIHEMENIHAERIGTGDLINPLLECEVSAYGSNQKYIPFESDVREKIQEEIIKKNQDIKVSLYFRNLRNGPWFGIDEGADFAPASLMKLPVAIAYAKWGEGFPELWGLSLTGITDTNDIQNIIPAQSIEAGKFYNVDTLIRYALMYSDNNANTTLLTYIPVDIIFTVFRELNLPIIDEIEAGENDFISVKEYASFFRILYNASYLSRDKSSYLLNIMTQSTMTGGIRNTIPSNIRLAHKFGERRIMDEKNGSYISQFHDCGIIYYDKYPYILCIMTKGGDDMKRLETIVENVSSIIFKEIQSRYR